MDRKRVVVTGLGAVTPLGNTRDAFWQALIEGRSGVGPVTSFDPKDLATKIIAEVKDFDGEALLGKREARRVDRFAQFAVVAAREALEDAQFPTDDKEVLDRTGVVVGTGIGGMTTLQDQVTKARAAGSVGRISPFFVPMLMANAAPAQISMAYRLRGPIFAVSSACASANDGMAIAYENVANGACVAAVTGGSESAVSDVAMGGFDSMKALSTRNDDPTKASRPFDRERDGFVLAEGGAILVLEEREFALRRGARIYAEMLGYGQSADAYNLVAVDPSGSGVELALKRVLEASRVEPHEVQYINAHGTSTPIGDPAESKAIANVFGDAARSIGVSSTKSMHGHALGAAGALEGVATVLAVYHDIMPPTINYEFPDPDCTLDYVPNVARRAHVDVALSNSFGFGGHNCVVAFRKHRD